MRPAPIRWPGNAKIAVSFFVAFESFIHHSQYRRGGDRPDYASLAYGEYGGKAGIWRILETLGRHGVKGTIDTNGLAAEKYPDAARELARGGHELVGHGWANDIYLTSLEPAEEREVIHRTLETIAAVTGCRPVGWVSPGHRINEHTFDHLVEAGIHWTGDLPGPDVPEHRLIRGKPLVVMPRLDYANDHSMIFQPKNPPRYYFESFKTAFDRLYAEGETGSPKLIDALVHAHIGGRPHIIGVFEECIAYAKSFSDVWFCTKGEIARWYLDNYVLRDSTGGNPQ
ncbi:MAG TPA: polysaccharide deacetylase family protein [candidate division Zixibacteria bacterium]|nr:polysaccharide deacetylase family protein [candidate division Zixibacteria bacterium]